MQRLIRLSAFCNTWIEQSLAILGMTMVAVVVLQVIFRYILNNSLFWSEELVRYLLMWLTFLGASCAYHRNVHPGIDVLSNRLPPLWKQRLSVCVHLISLVFFGVMIYHGTIFAYFVRAQISPAMAIPKWLIFSVVPLSGVLFFMHCLALLFSEFSREHHDR
ncbi:MAG: TRAP transporter small permease [Desulfocapsaceae bacterium]|nr:TRAP transporter small permease [Desulfocapsaceae bacterium]